MLPASVAVQVLVCLQSSRYVMHDGVHSHGTSMPVYVAPWPQWLTVMSRRF